MSSSWIQAWCRVFSKAPDSVASHLAQVQHPVTEQKAITTRLSFKSTVSAEMLHDLGLVDGSPRPPSSTGWQGTHGNFLAAFFVSLPYFYLFPLFVYS